MKKSKKRLLKNLSLSEIHCKCEHDDCRHTFLAESTLRSFQELRKEFKSPIDITSAFRCQRHNKDVGGVINSRHKIGLALDLTNKRLDKLEFMARKHFNVVIRYPDFIHCANLRSDV